MNSIKEMIKSVRFLNRIYKILQGKIRRVTLIYPLFIKVNPPISYFVKPYQGNKKITLEITYDCNIKCYNCNRLCRQAPSKTCMSAEQIERFINESNRYSITWNEINVCGGEPTLNNELFDILNLLLLYRNKHSSKTIITLYTNGFGKAVKIALEKIPSNIQISNSLKTKRIHKFHPVNIAPIDSFFYKNADFSLGCPMITICGIGLTPYGYYPCPMAGSIDRVFGFNLGKKDLSNLDESFVNVKKKLCQYCGAFRFSRLTKKEKFSLSWEKALCYYNDNIPILDLY
jgi:sulfatase maturation enzyme AslB (radical SAM superfamily)